MTVNVDEAKQQIDKSMRKRGRPVVYMPNATPEEREEARRQRHKEAVKRRISKMSDEQKREEWRVTRHLWYQRRKLRKVIDEAERVNVEPAPENI